MSRNHCPNRTVLGILNCNGTMAEYLTLPIRNLHKVPDQITDEEAVFAEPLAAACRIVEQNLVHYGRYDNNTTGSTAPNHKYVPHYQHPDRVAILGDGKLGLMIAEVWDGNMPNIMVLTQHQPTKTTTSAATTTTTVVRNLFYLENIVINSIWSRMSSIHDWYQNVKMTMP
jgi:hypothetical protein